MFDPDNAIIKLCAEGMALEGQGNAEAARAVFLQAWNGAKTDLEKFTAAHYVARHQKSVADKLTWDETALQCALKLTDASFVASYPSLYLNVAKGYEDLKDLQNAKKHYAAALAFAGHLPDDGYGQMIRGGIANGIKRIENLLNGLQ